MNNMPWPWVISVEQHNIPSLSLSPMPVYFWQAMKSMHVAISPLVSKHSFPPGSAAPPVTPAVPSPWTAA